LSRQLANNNHYPAIDILASVSRLMPDLVDSDTLEKAGFIKNILAIYKDAQDLISIGAYRPGSSPEIDQAIELIGQINELLRQKVGENFSMEETVKILESIYDRRSV
jgi:flagellum-specific ATP synthase